MPYKDPTARKKAMQTYYQDHRDTYIRRSAAWKRKAREKRKRNIAQLLARAAALAKEAPAARERGYFGRLNPGRI